MHHHPDPLPWSVPHSEFVTEFAASMPAEYRARFHGAHVWSHAGIVFRRGTNPTHVERWDEQHGATAICVVADDAPGLLSLVSASIVVHDLDVVAAQVYCRETRDGLGGRRREAVDLFWLTTSGEAAPGPVGDASIQRVANVLGELVRGKVDVESATRRAEALRDQADMATTHVWFEDEPRDGLTELHIETEDRPGLLFTITATLFRARVVILRSLVTTADGRARDRFLCVDMDGHPLGKARRRDVQTMVLAAIETRWKLRAAGG
jgi:[protein-PII] uridylyltransferase